VVERVGQVVRFGFNVTFAPVPCFNSTDLWDTGAARVLEVEQWLYQVCTAVVLPAVPPPARPPISLHCTDVVCAMCVRVVMCHVLCRRLTGRTICSCPIRGTVT
jgi:hypothetical protein